MRTPARNWRLGKTEINILLVAVILNGQALPLVWTLLPHEGSFLARAAPMRTLGRRSSAVRNALLERVLLVLPAKRIAGLLGDREFIGKKWFKFLNNAKVAPCIRPKANTKVGGIPVWALFKGIPTGEVRWWYRPLMVYGVPLRVCAVRDVYGHLLYVATLEHGRNALERSSRRWTIEEGFLDDKSGLFGLEASRLRDAASLERLVLVISTATLFLVSEGLQVVEQGLRRVVDPP